MIVKNEAHIIEETLMTICEYIPFDYWVICDTGSTDSTPDIIHNFFIKRGISGDLYFDEWQDFAYNRNLALKRCQGHGDYVFFFDADDTIKGQLTLPDSLTADAYYFKFSNALKSNQFERILLVKNNIEVRWRGVVHEFIELPKYAQTKTIAGSYQIIGRSLGARSQNEDKYLDDAQLLEQALASPNDPDLTPRYQFYCAQSYRDAGIPDLALKWYLKRADNPEGWAQERYVSYLQAGYIYNQKKEFAQALFQFQLGTAVDPKRAECWYQLARIHSWENHFYLAYLFAEQAMQCEILPHQLFVNRDMFLYWGAFEYTLNACRLGKFAEGYSGLKKLVAKAPTNLFAYLNPYFDKLREEMLRDSYREVQELKKQLDNRQLTEVKIKLGL